MSYFNSNCYLPQPPRAWSRVQNSCSVITDTDNTALVIDPYTRQLVSRIVLAERLAMLNKGNILQYKANSSYLTKSQKYSKIAKGQWVNRNTTWATQSARGYTNPNTSGLKRSGNVVNIAIDPITGAIIGPTESPITCLKPITPVNEVLPNNGGGGSDIDDPDIPPPVEPSPSSETFPSIISDPIIEPIVIQDQGILICSVQENVCTGETKSSISQQLCHPTTDSDVPGPIQELCWNDGTQTWFPRQRYVMTNSANKWPTNATLFSAIRPSPPVITSITSNINIVTLTWTQSEICLPVSFFNIFQDGNFIQSVSGTIFTIDIIVDNCNIYSYFIIAVTNGSNIPSDPSNTVSISISYIEPPINLQYTTPESGSINLTWSPNPNCATSVSYNVYFDSNIDNTFDLSYRFNNLINCSSYTFSVSALDVNGNESTLNTIIAIPLWPNPPTNLTALMSGSISIIILNWSAPDPNCSPPTSYTLYWSIDNNTFDPIPDISPEATSYNFTNAMVTTTYYFYMVSVVNSVGTSGPTPTISITTPFIYLISGDTNYTEVINGNTYTLTFNTNGDNNGNFTLTFYVDLDEIIYTLIGGGGGGRGSAYYPNSDPDLELVVGGVGGGGASSVICFGNSAASLGAPDSLSLVVGKGGKGGLTTTGPPPANRGNTTSVTGISGTIFYATAPGGNASTTIVPADTSLGTVYCAVGALNADTPTFFGAYRSVTIGGGSQTGSGIIHSGNQSNASRKGGNGNNADNPSGNLPYGGGGGTTIIDDLSSDTFTGSFVSLNDVGGLKGINIDNQQFESYLPGNQKSEDELGTTETPGVGSGGGGGGLIWLQNGPEVFGVGGVGGDGLMIITFTFIQ